MVAMETGAMDVAFGTGAVLIFVVIIINATSTFLLKRFMKKIS
jgi:phosphate transport system permease protein